MAGEEEETVNPQNPTVVTAAAPPRTQDSINRLTRPTLPSILTFFPENSAVNRVLPSILTLFPENSTAAPQDSINYPTSDEIGSSPLPSMTPLLPGNSTIDPAAEDLDIPTGYRFEPKAEELLSYLEKKLRNQPLRTNKIQDADVYQQEPGALTERYKAYGQDEQWYFFSSRSLQPNHNKGNRPGRKTRDEVGWWKARGVEIDVKNNAGAVIGKKRTLGFRIGRNNQDQPSDWAMDEYSMAKPSRNNDQCTEGSSKDLGTNSRKLDDVICKIYKSRRKSNKADEPQQGEMNSEVHQGFADYSDHHQQQQEEEAPDESALQQKSSIQSTIQQLNPTEMQEQSHVGVGLFGLNYPPHDLLSGVSDDEFTNKKTRNGNVGKDEDVQSSKHEENKPDSSD